MRISQPVTDFSGRRTALAAAITPRTRAVIAVHIYGHPAPMEKYFEITGEPADQPIAVIEDAAQAIGTVCRIGPNGRAMKAGTMGLWGWKQLRKHRLWLMIQHLP